MATPSAGGGSDLLIDLLRRSPMLEALREGALDRGALQDRLGVSRATCHRHTRLLGDLGAIERVDGAFELTPSGRLLADAIATFERDARAALRLAPVLSAIAEAPRDIDVEAFAGAMVTSAERGDPYSPVARFVELARGSATLRGLDLDAVAPLYLAEIQGRIVDGMETTAVSLPAVTANALESYPEKCIEACESGHLSVLLHPDLPFSLALFDDRVGIGITDANSRNLRVFADTDAPAVREWAEALYASYESEAAVMEEYTERGFERAMAARTGAG